MAPTETNASLVDLVRNRTERMTLGGCGIRLASDYVRGVLVAAGLDGAVMFPDAPNLLKEAETRLVYRNDEMAYEPPMTSMPAIERYCKSVGVDVPPRTLMVFENIVSTSQEDRDGDVLCSEGAIIDPKMPLLWHHMLPAIVGKMLAVREQNSNHIRVASAVMESPLGQDVANLIEFGALRISHGFRPLEFAPRERDKGLHDGRHGSRGFRISSFECLEESVVSVPSNTGAEIIAWSRGKVHTPLIKSWCKSLYDQRDKVFPSGAVQKISIPIELKIDVRPTFAEDSVVGAHVIQPAGPEVIVPDYSIGERPPQEGETFTEKRNNTELSQQEVRDFIRSLKPGDLVAVEEKTEADVAQDSQVVYRGWNGRVEEVSPDYAEVAVVKTDGSPARIEASGRYRALVRQPEPKPEASAMDMLRIEPQPKRMEVEVKGGEGSGHFGHEGRPGEVGGSSGDGGGGGGGQAKPQLGDSPGGKESYSDRIEGTQAEADREVKRADKAVDVAKKQLAIVKHSRDTFDADSKAIIAKALAPMEARLAEIQVHKAKLLSKLETIRARLKANKEKLAGMRKLPKRRRAAGDDSDDNLDESLKAEIETDLQAAKKIVAEFSHLANAIEKLIDDIRAVMTAHGIKIAKPKAEPKAATVEAKEDDKPTPEAIQLGQDAARQAANGHNPPNWAVDEELWERAKKAASKTYDEGDEAYWPVVVTIYQNMGGTIQGKTKTATAIEEKAMDAKKRAVCPECGEAVEVDDEECPECGADLTEKAAHMEIKEGPSEAARAAGTLLEVIDGVRSAIRVASNELGTAGQHVGDVRTFFTSGEKAAKPEKPEEGEAPPELDNGAKLDEAVTAIGKAKGALKEANGGCNQMKKRMSEKSFVASELVEWDSEKKAFFAKAGRVLSAENEGKLRAALDALRTILEKVEPPAPEGTFKPVPEPATPDTNVMAAKPAETTANKPTPVDLYKPDGSLSLQASAQAIVRRMLDPMDATDIRTIGKLAEAISAEMKSHERANRRASFRKVLSLTR